MMFDILSLQWNLPELSWWWLSRPWQWSRDTSSWADSRPASGLGSRSWARTIDLQRCIAIKKSALPCITINKYNTSGSRWAHPAPPPPNGRGHMIFYVPNANFSHFFSLASLTTRPPPKVKPWSRHEVYTVLSIILYDFWYSWRVHWTTIMWHNSYRSKCQFIGW